MAVRKYAKNGATTKITSLGQNYNIGHCYGDGTVTRGRALSA